MNLQPEKVAEMNMLSPQQKWDLILAQVNDTHTIDLYSYLHIARHHCRSQLYVLH